MASLSETSLPFLDPDSVLAITKDANQVMVYGWNHCKYLQVGSAIDKMGEVKGFPIQGVFSCMAGDPNSDEECHTTLEKRNFALLPYNAEEALDVSVPRMCKTALTNLVLENYKRSKEGLPLIPILFCLDREGNKYTVDIRKMCSKSETANRAMTNKELRRGYKLWTYKNPEIQAIAKATFRFVRLKKGLKSAYTLQTIPSPYDTAEFARNWEYRKMRSTVPKKPAALDWKTHFDQQIEAYIGTMKEASKKSSSATSPGVG